MKFAAWILGSIPVLIQLYADKDKAKDLEATTQELEKDLNFPNPKTYDFIVVGGGTAGSYISAKLSEHYSVLLLESGGSAVPATENPAFVPYTDTHPSINNLFTSIPQLNFTQENGGIVRSFTGRMLGGSVSHNANIYNRGSPQDYNKIAELLEDPSWNYENVVKHFKAFENYVGPLLNEEEREAYYGNVGAFTVEPANPPMKEAWLKAGVELGYLAGDPNGFQKESFTTVVKSIKNGERCSSYTAFLKPIENSRASLTVHRYSHVEEIKIDPITKTAEGVIYNRHAFPQIAYASKEVIISSGTFQSPLLLIKSGIGPKETIEAAEIPIHSEVEGVGANLHNHGWVLLDFVVKKANDSLFSRVRSSQYLDEVEKYQKSREGYFSSMEEGLQAFVTSEKAKQAGEDGWPDLQIIYIQNLLEDEEASSPLPISIIVDLNRPTSKGKIGFDSDAWKMGQRDDTRLALVDHKLFSDAEDVEALMQGIKIALQIAENTTVFKNMETELDITKLPLACSHLPSRSDEYWKCFIEQRADADMHMVGTCKSGKQTDPLAVLDNKFRVRGIKKLRVIDGSALPFVTNANVNSAVILAAAKGCEDILTEYPPPKDGNGNGSVQISGMSLTLFISVSFFILNYFVSN